MITFSSLNKGFAILFETLDLSKDCGFLICCQQQWMYLSFIGWLNHIFKIVRTKMLLMYLFWLGSGVNQQLYQQLPIITTATNILWSGIASLCNFLATKSHITRACRTCQACEHARWQKMKHWPLRPPFYRDVTRVTLTRWWVTGMLSWYLISRKK